VTDQVLGLLVREIMERLQHHDLELQDRVIGLAASVALALPKHSRTWLSKTYRSCSAGIKGFKDLSPFLPAGPFLLVKVYCFAGSEVGASRFVLKYSFSTDV